MLRLPTGIVVGLVFMLTLFSAGGLAWAKGGVTHYAGTRLTSVDPGSVEHIELAEIQLGTTVIDAQRFELFKMQRRYYRVEPNALLSDVFPDVRLHWIFTKADGAKAMIVSESRAYRLDEFNLLLGDLGVEIDAENVFEITQSFAVLALGEKTAYKVMSREKRWGAIDSVGCPEVTFMKSKQTYQPTSWGGRGPDIRRAWFETKSRPGSAKWGFHIESGFIVEASIEDSGVKSLLLML